jgi:type VI secretion system protein ImpK
MGADGAGWFLLGRFSDFYQEVAAIKQAQADQKLAEFLAVGDEARVAAPEDQAARASGRLATLLARQLGGVRAGASPLEVEAYGKAMYAMAALADEIFILELDWQGRAAWLDNLLEQRLFRSCGAGQRLFMMIEALLRCRDRNPLHVDLAAVYLLVLQLGFKGVFRGPGGAARLQQYRTRLFDLVHGQGGAGAEFAFPQAYSQPVPHNLPEQRVAPLSPWLSLCRTALILYAVVSSVVWAGLLLPFVKSFGAW